MENFISPDNTKYKFLLFISGMSVRSGHAVENLKKICDTHLEGRFELEIFDIAIEKHLAVEHQIIAIPTLIKVSPAPRRMVIGDLSDTEKVLNLLDINLR